MIKTFKNDDGAIVLTLNNSYIGEYSTQQAAEVAIKTIKALEKLASGKLIKAATETLPTKHKRDPLTREKEKRVERGIYTTGTKFRVRSPNYIGSYPSLELARQARARVSRQPVLRPPRKPKSRPLSVVLKPAQRPTKKGDISYRLTLLEDPINSTTTTLCECGTEFQADTKKLIYGQIKSCGCLRFYPDLTKASPASYKRTYETYQALTLSDARKTLPDAWLHPTRGFDDFLKKVGHQPEGTTLDLKTYKFTRNQP